MSYTISFDRVGRNHNVPDVTVETLDFDTLADEVLRIAGKHCGSRDLEVAASTEEMRGVIFAGFRNAGTFTITETEGTCDRPGCTHDRGSHWDGTGACGFCGCGSWTVTA